MARMNSHISIWDKVFAVAELLKKYHEEAMSLSVAVLTPYKAQHSLLRSHFRSYGMNLSNVEFATVDGFQVKSRNLLPLFCTLQTKPLLLYIWCSHLSCFVSAISPAVQRPSIPPS